MTDTRIIEHGSICKKPEIALRISWDGKPEVYCKNCGKYAPANDQRPERGAER